MQEEVGDFAEQLISEAFVGELAHDQSEHPKPIREKLLQDYARFDPVTYTPAGSGHVLHQIETEYSQSVGVGNAVLRAPGLAGAETRFLECLRMAEEEWNLLGRESAVATKFVQLLRRAATILVKRSVGYASDIMRMRRNWRSFQRRSEARRSWRSSRNRCDRSSGRMGSGST